MRRFLLPLSLAFCVQLSAAETKSAIQWVDWNAQLFPNAKKENRFVILDLEAVWCHWCHVMEEKTYRNPKVQSLIRSKFIAVRVDQDSRPDLSNRYEDYGWPATIIFSPEGKELAKLSGFIQPERMVEILTDPEHAAPIGKEKKLEVAESAFLRPEQIKTLEKSFDDEYDTQYTSWGTGHKLLEAPSTEWAIHLTSKGDKKSEKRAKDTLKNVTKILDPAWGGIYQYSAEGWNEPHFEKIMQFQSDAIRTYALAYAQWGNKEYLRSAQEVRRFLNTFLKSPEGGYYTSQDADLVQGVHSDGYFKLNDKARRAKGIPRIDKHQYARENGWAAEALITLATATKDPQPLQEAQSAVEWVMKNRATSDGGFRHDSDDAGRMYLGDSLSMGYAFLKLYGATGDRKWLKSSEAAMKYIEKNFTFTDESGHQGGFVTAKSPDQPKLNPQRDENVLMARYANLLYQYTGEESYRKDAESAMKLLVSPLMLDRFPSAALLTADNEIKTPPLHLTVVGEKKDPEAKSLFVAALAYPSTYKRTEWYDKNEGPLPHSGVQFPPLKKAAAFVCTENRCSLPIYDPNSMQEKISRLLTSFQGR